MARFPFILPDIGEGIASAEIVAWHVQVGDVVAEDQPVADLMTDKATVEMESPVSGVVRELAGAVGDDIAIGSTLMVIDTEASEARESEKPVDSAPVERRLEQSVADAGPAPATSGPAASEKVQASPAVRARARALGIDLALVRHEGDRLRHGDLDAYLLYAREQGYGAPSPPARADESVKIVGLRRRIAEKMAEAKRHIPHFTYVEEIDVTALEAMRAELNAARGARPKLTLLPFLIVATCRIIPDFPAINAHYDDDSGTLTRFGAVHMGVATQTPGGLMVPVVRDAHGMNLWQLADAIATLAESARDGRIAVEQLSGSTLTLTSLGPLGGVASTPIINRPEVAILGPNRIVERPVIRDGELAVAKLMNLSISCDHRVIDGHDAARFVQALKQLLETPVRLFA